jgi:hypothetical protein
VCHSEGACSRYLIDASLYLAPVGRDNVTLNTFSPQSSHMDILEWAYAMVEALIPSYRLEDTDSTDQYLHGDWRRGDSRNTKFISKNLRFASESRS